MTIVGAYRRTLSENPCSSDSLMKRIDLEKRLRLAGCYLKRQGAEHALWINPQTGIVEAIPRHTEIKEPLARKILRNLGAESI